MQRQTHTLLKTGRTHFAAVVRLQSQRDSSSEVATGINILKGGSDPPLKADDEYPAWVSQLAEPQLTFTELKRTVAARPDQALTLEEGSRWLKLDNRNRIKARNNSFGKL